jgi:hypothetical protein
MNTIAVWILIITFGGSSSSTPRSRFLIDNIATLEECQRLAKVIMPDPGYFEGARCVQAIKVKP